MKQKLVIREVQQDDVSEVVRLFDEFSEYLAAGQTFQSASQLVVNDILSREDIAIFVAEIDGRLVGLTTLYFLPSIRHGNNRARVEDMFVSEDARKAGVAQALFAAAKEYCKENGVSVIKLDSGNELVDAHRFYEKQGGITTERFFRFDL